MRVELYFRDNFFNSGVTEIWNGAEEEAGSVDLRSAFGAAVDVYKPGGGLAYSGGFGFFSSKWSVSDISGREIGKLRLRMTFLSKRYTYDAFDRGELDIVSEAFSKEYEMIDNGAGETIARFAKTNGWLAASSAYRLDNRSGAWDSYELIAVIMGVNALQSMNNH